MALLSRDDIINVSDRKTVEVEVPEWGGSVMVRSLTGRERDNFEASNLNKNGGKPDFANFRAKFVALCVVDESGKRLFATRAEIDMLGNKSAAALDRVFTEAQKLNAVSEKDVEDMTEDFDEAEDEDSTSD